MSLPSKPQLEKVDCCPVCGGAGQYDIRGYDPEYSTVIQVYSCTRCQTSYHNPRMTGEALLEYYASGKYRKQERRAIVESSAQRRIRATLHYIDQYARVQPQRCLDVGCSRGYLARAIHERYGAEALGYDVYHDPQAVIEILDNKDIITGKFDLITCIHVLEHFPDPVRELEWMAGILEQDGMLVIEIPTLRVVTLPHPVIFSREAVPFMMRRIGAEYIFIDIQVINIGIILAWRTNENNRNDS